jgi:hypothetical protein
MHVKYFPFAGAYAAAVSRGGKLVVGEEKRSFENSNSSVASFRLPCAIADSIEAQLLFEEEAIEESERAPDRLERRPTSSTR